MRKTEIECNVDIKTSSFLFHNLRMTLLFCIFMIYILLHYALAFHLRAFIHFPIDQNFRKRDWEFNNFFQKEFSLNLSGNGNGRMIIYFHFKVFKDCVIYYSSYFTEFQFH